MMPGWHEFGGWGMGLGWLFMLLFWGVVVAAIVAIVRSVSGAGGRKATDASGEEHHQAPREIVQQRYARGEIDREEYEQKMQDLDRLSL